MEYNIEAQIVKRSYSVSCQLAMKSNYSGLTRSFVSPRPARKLVFPSLPSLTNQPILQHHWVVGR